ncbi:hypothetical protein BST45_14410 [Mycobacterium shinjukuense]|nr:hypothetical protein BST45_14410 [Mycobacterium shinjukuense]
MIGFGLVVGVVAASGVVVLGAAAGQGVRAPVFAVGVCAGIVGVSLNYLLVSRVVRRRLRVLSARLTEAQREIAASAGAESWEPLADRYALPVDSDDEFGQAMASFNYLVSSLDSSQMAERALRHRLVDQAKLAALATLTAGVAHETKNPLNFVVNFAELNLELCAELRAALPGESEALISDIETNLNYIRRHAERALAVMATMLQVGRSNVGDAQPCRVNQIVEESVGIAEHSWRINRREGRCAIHVELDSDDPVVRGFEGDLVQVIVNLVMNGLEAASSVPDRTGEVRISVQHDDDSAVVVVVDNGPGIDQETLCHIFEPFFTTKYRKGGTGLGLFICRDIIDNRHHGTLGASSRPGAGASFVVKLPLDHASAKTAARAAIDRTGERPISWWLDKPTGGLQAHGD